MAVGRILLIEPFYGGSHKTLIDILKRALVDKYGEDSVDLVTMKAKKWHWKARTAALHLSEVIPLDRGYRFLFASSVLNLAELLALRSDLGGSTTIVYFHENQLVYPVRKVKERDFQYGYNQILTCLVADRVLFNSEFNKVSFLGSIDKFLRLDPDYRPAGGGGSLGERLAGKSRVVGLPLPAPSPAPPLARDFSPPVHIVWPHRWEHDKNPIVFLEVVERLQSEGVDFRVSVLGEAYPRGGEAEEVLKARERLGGKALGWGFLDRESYQRVLSTAHVAVSTALHEFYGVAMLEAAMLGCFPLCPNSLVYPEIYPSSCLYGTPLELYERLKGFCEDPASLKKEVESLNMDFSPFTEETLMPTFLDLFSDS